MASPRVTYAATGKECCPSCSTTMARNIILMAFFPFIIATETTVYNRPKETFASLYSTGVEAYNDQTWFLCASSLENAIKDYRFYKDTVIDCRIQCKKSTTIREVTPEMVEFSVFERMIENSDCIRRCKRDKFGEKVYPDPRDRIFTTFQGRKPYEYLQFCWFQLDRLQDAASAAYTFYLTNPDHEDMVSNIRYYKDKAGIHENDFLDLELKPYKEAYVRGLMAYNSDDWEGVKTNMELAITEFYHEEERCRAECENIYESARPLEFVSAVADHYLSVLECQHSCERKLSRIFTEEIGDYVADHFHYLQFAYYKLKNDDKSMEAAATFLLFQPGDETMQRNKGFYLQKGYAEKDFKLREQAVIYLDRKHQMERILDFSQTNYLKDTSDLVKPLDEESEVKATNEEKQSGYWMKQYERIGLKLVSHGDQLKGEKRFAADGFLRKEQCFEIISLVHDKKANQYGAKVVTMTDAVQMLEKEDLNSEVSLRLLLRIAETTRHYLMKYYSLTRLFFKHTSVVCWGPETGLDASSFEGCIPQEDGSCIEELPSNIGDEEYIGVTYLSDIPADEGSNIYFMSPDKKTESKVGMKCGRLVAFESSDHHGVSIPYSEQRCALVIRYTTDPTKDDQAYIETIKTLHNMDVKYLRSDSNTQQHTLEDLKKSGISITKDGADMKGGERVMADGLAKDEECQTLTNLVLTHGTEGSGYEGNSFPHTLQENFKGFTMIDAWELANSEKVSYAAVELFVDLSERSRLFTEKYFNVTKPLYFDFTHLVCRSAIDDSNLDRSDLSHPVHADNCMLKPDGSCPKEFPAYIQRDYSAILYLNHEFEGGEFFFAHKNKSAQVNVSPKCGRLVSFNAGEFHGVKAVVKGTRCALALWFTTNPQFKELAHLQALKILATKRKEREQKNQKEFSKTEL
ncbi:prolyl 3-hydroxylase 1-like isoform X2 [Haliotis rubra]|uniref:prolyl 3-hydroxylase 1-like isoform X2 n=1 Tax=Haliotis rubra TaxID=36100 RepID=UPI001EE58BA0|nr:prolyl 3-hydroxylase 1-like isoform X2 [Haliotis rubra]